METIAAISTAPGTGGIGIIRISGKKTFDVINKIFFPKNKSTKIKGNSIKYGKIINNKTSQTIDEVLVSFFISPNSYTKEDMCEINCHGGIVVMQEILKLCLENGALLAEPGEFTKRAFLNGRIDLAQAESVIDIINAKTKNEAKASIGQLQGQLSKKIQEVEEILIYIMSNIEVNIDYPEYDVEEMTSKKALQVLEETYKELTILEKSFETGKIIKEGIKIAIIGKPNVGKSSLLNLILEQDRAIVTECEGTTRDTIEEFIKIKDIPIKLIDTAGIRQTDDKIEQIGIEKSKKAIKDADLIIAIFDVTKGLSKEDEEILEIIKERKSIIILNKIDSDEKLIKSTTKEIKSINKPTIEVSARTGEGIEKLYDKITEMFNLGDVEIENDIVITSIRHKNIISKALRYNEKAIEACKTNNNIDIIAIDIKEILDSLGEITGKNVAQEIINKIFKEFCLGK